MSEITADKIKDLRQRTGVGMAKCKEALVLSEGSMDKAIEHLRKTGMAASVKKEGRETKEGVIGVQETKDAIGLIEVNCETDFVAKNEKFVHYVDSLAKQIAANKVLKLDAFLSEKSSADPSMSVEDHRNQFIQSFGENIQIKRIELIEKAKDASYGIYSHMGGKIVTVVEIKGDAHQPVLAKDIAMHIAAEDPSYLSPELVPHELIKKEEEVAKAQIKNKPENIVEKIIQGKINAYLDQVCLVGQKFIKDPSVSVADYVKQIGKEANKTLKITCFWRWEIGQ